MYEFSKVVEYKISWKRSIALLYTCNKQSENEILKKFIYNSIKNKILRNEFNKRSEKYILKYIQIYLKEIKDLDK